MLSIENNIIIVSNDVNLMWKSMFYERRKHSSKSLSLDVDLNIISNYDTLP